MKILALCEESYPVMLPASYVLFHQSMSLERLGHEVHLFNVRKPVLPLLEYLDAYEFDLIYLDLEHLRSQSLLHYLKQYRVYEPIRVVASLLKLPAPPDNVWDVVDFAVTPWKGKTIESLVRTRDVRHLPLGYNPVLHVRNPDLPPLGPVFVGNTAGEREPEAEAYLKALREERTVLCIGPGHEQKYLDPFMLGRVYAGARCLPNFHYAAETGEDLILNERFWQSARCGIPVNDRSPLMEELWNDTLLEAFCFADRQSWQDRVRRLNSGADHVNPEAVAELDLSLAGHSYDDRMRHLMQWLA
jgi:hypothetical protein